MLKLTVWMTALLLSTHAFAETFVCHGVRGNKANLVVTTDHNEFKVTGSAEFPSKTVQLDCLSFRLRTQKYAQKVFFYQDFNRSEKCAIDSSRMSPDFATNGGFLALVDDQGPSQPDWSNSQYAYAYCDKK